jgi:hypothetical protein
MDKLEKAARVAIKAYYDRDVAQGKYLRRAIEALENALPDPRDRVVESAKGLRAATHQLSYYDDMEVCGTGKRIAFVHVEKDAWDEFMQSLIDLGKAGK